MVEIKKTLLCDYCRRPFSHTLHFVRPSKATNTEIRYKAKSEGWGHSNGIDACPECRNKNKGKHNAKKTI